MQILTEIILLATAIVFFFIGRWSHKDMLSEARKIAQKRLNKVQAGTIDYPTPEQLNYTGSRAEEVDKAIEKNFRENGVKP